MTTHSLLPNPWLAASAALALLAPAARADSLDLSDPKLKVPDKVTLAAQPFPLGRVRLLEGPFLHAQELDRQYLLGLDVERLLHNFRLNAGLPSTAQPLGGWEEPACELRGHFVGHYLTACALMYATTGDERLKQKADALVAGLAQCQAKFPSGYLSAFPESFLDRVEARQNVWAPYYTLHKILAGLLDFYVYADNRQALDVGRKFGDWVIARNTRLSDEQMQAMLGNEHGGLNEALAYLYALTGEDKYLKISLRFNHQAVLGPAAQRLDKLTGLHANTQIPKFVGAALQYELTADDSLKTAARFFWETVVNERSYVIGGHSDGESFSPKERLSTALGPNTTETCNTYNMLKLTRHLFCWEPRVEYADYYERALLNHILASQNPRDGMMCYYVPLRSGSCKQYCGPLNSFWCCTGTGIENHAKYGDSIYFHAGDSTLYVNLFIASELDWPSRGFKLRQENAFPKEGQTRLLFTCPKPTALEVKLRRPAWAAAAFVVTINGQPQPVAATPGSWASLNRAWQSGDVVTIDMPFSPRTEGFADNPDRFAFLNGPLVLAAQVDPTRPFPAVVATREEAVQALAPAGAPNTFLGPATFFRAPGGPAAAITLEPFYALHGGRHYVVYFDRFTPAQWQTKETDYAAQLARDRELAARSVDYVVPDREQSERDHHMRGEKTAAGDFSDRQWRHASDGGWFSWQLKTLPGQALELSVTYWGSDDGNRVFDILVDDRKIATETLARNQPGKFFDQTYPIPAGLLEGKTAITVKFLAHPGATAGGVFGARLLKAASRN